MTGATLPMLAVGVPLAGAALIGLAGSRPNLRETVTLSTAVLLFALVLSILPGVLDGERPAATLLHVAPALTIAFTVEPLGMLFAMIASGLWIVNSIYSIGYMRGNDEPRQTAFYICFAVALASTMGIAFAGNLFTLFAFYEVLTLSTYPLVTHRGNAEAIKAGRLYLVLLLGSSFLLFLPAIVWTGFLAGTLDFKPGGILDGKADPGVVGILLALYVFGIGKAAVMPMHPWLPAAMVAPTPVSALLHAVAVVKAGVFSIVKVVIYVFGLDLLAAGGAQWLPWVAGATVLTASLVALRQDDLKRRLAFSTVSQLSYIVLAVSVLAPISAIGAALHIAAHAFGKITLFFAAGSIYTAAHLTKVSQLPGIGHRMPWTMGAFAVGTLSMIGVPPTAGFIGKWYILVGAMSVGEWVAVAVIVLSTVLNAAYFLPIVFSAFFRSAPAGHHGDHGEHASGEAPWPIVLALTVTAAATIAMFAFPGLPLALGQMMTAH
ncbi:MAG: monovalent cation/H+ antiporter subunit D family protein [Rhodospirillales bacterium]